MPGPSVTGPIASRPRRLALLSVAVASLVAGGPAAASTGASIDVGSIAISEGLSPGGEYRLPTFGVRNPGTEATSYELVVSYVDDQVALRPPAAWFRFSPGALTLNAGASTPVNTVLELPANAEPGDYAALIGPRIAVDGGGAQVGAGAAARLTFTVEPSTAIEAFLRWLWRFLAENPWLWIGLLLTSLIALAWFLRARFSLTISRRS